MIRIYLRHLFRTIRRKPLQPILITVILTLAFLLTNVCLSMSLSFRDNREARQKNVSGEADIILSPSAVSPSRFLDPQDVKTLLPDATVCGSYTLPYILDGEPVTGISVSFSDVGEIFSLSFSSAMEFPVSRRADMIFLSADFAEECGLAVGDPLSLSLFGKTVDYTVAGISPKPLPGNSAVMTDVSGTVGLLAEDSLFFSLLNGNTELYSKLYIRTADPEGAVSVLQTAFPTLNLENIAGESMERVEDGIFRVISFVLVFLTFIGAFAVTGGCTFCLGKERAEDAYLFSCAGVSRKKLDLYRHLEMLLYWGAALVLGVPLSFPFGRFCFDEIGFEQLTYSPTLLPVLVAAGAVLAISQTVPLLFSGRVRSRAARRTKTPLWWLVFPVLTVLLPLAALFVPNSRRFPWEITALVCLFLSLALYIPTVFRAATGFLGRRCRRISLRYAAKNAGAVEALSNTARLLLILSTVLSVMLTLVLGSIRYVNTTTEWLNADYAVIGGTERVTEKLEKVPSVGAVYGFANFDVVYDDTLTITWAVSSLDALNPRYTYFDRLPEGEEVCASYATLGKMDIEEGDVMLCTLGNETHELRVFDVVRSNTCFLLVDAETWNVPYNMFLIRGAEEVADEKLYADVTEALSTESVTVTRAENIVSAVIEPQLIYIFFGELLAVFLAVFAMIGIADTLWESYRSRATEFRLFSVGGFSKKRIAAMIAWECGLLLAFTLLCNILSYAWAMFISQGAMINYGSDIYALLFR